MKHSFLSHLTALAAAVLLLGACGPQSFQVALQVRQPSRSGMDFSRKTLSVVYLSDRDTAVENYAARRAENLARQLEMQWLDGRNGEVGLFCLQKDPRGDYSQRDSLIRLIVGTGDDVVFLLDTPESANSSAYDLYVMDSMSGSDEVRHYAGAGSIGSEFAPEWHAASFEVLYFDSAKRWVNASDHAYCNEWEDAVRIWMELAADSSGAVRRAAACYNCAIGCYLLGDKALALKWLDRADASCELAQSRSLRRLFNTLK